MVDNTNGRKRERIGLSLAPDVIDILDEYGRTTKRCADCHKVTDPSVVCASCGHPCPMQPTRTEIIEQAVRQWAANDFDSEIASRIQTDAKKEDKIVLTRGNKLIGVVKRGSLARDKVVSLPKPGKNK